MDKLLAPLRARWARLASRERLAVTLMALVVGAFVLWMALIRPALRTIDEAHRQLDALETQLQSMQTLAAETRTLRATVPVPAAQAATALKSATERLGERARLVQQGERAVLTVSGVSGEQLRAWLAEVRSAARARAVEAALSRGPQGFSGTLVVSVASGG